MEIAVEAEKPVPTGYDAGNINSVSRFNSLEDIASTQKNVFFEFIAKVAVFHKTNFGVPQPGRDETNLRPNA